MDKPQVPTESPQTLESQIERLYEVVGRVDKAVFGEKALKGEAPTPHSSRFSRAIEDISINVGRLRTIAEELERV